MTERYTVIPRTLCFVFYQDRILLIKKKFDKNYYYNALGGHIEYAEDIIENAQRELLEEAGIKVKDTYIAGIVHAVNFFGENVIVFVTVSTALNEKITASDEGELIWYPVAQIGEINIFKDLELFLE